MPSSNPQPDEPYIDQLPEYAPPINGNGTVVAFAHDDDDDLIDYEGDDEAVTYDDVDDEMVQLQARTDQLAQVYQQREAARVHRKVSASVAGAAVAGGVPAILSAVDALNLSPQLQPFVLAVAAVLGTLVAGYVTPERKPVI